ncbi:MAG: hypothetical protein P8X79_16875 [Reinekea sp.]
MTAITNLTANRGLTEEQHTYLTNRGAPQDLQHRHNTLVNQTHRAVDLANIERSYVSREARVNSGTRPEEHVQILNGLRLEWDNMRNMVQAAMEAGQTNELNETDAGVYIPKAKKSQFNCHFNLNP